MSEISKSEYCSGWFPEFNIGGQNVRCWVPKPGKVLSKTFMIRAHETNPGGVLRGIALGLLHYPLDPVLDSVCNAIENKLKHLDPIVPSYISQFDEYNPNPLLPSLVNTPIVRFTTDRSSADWYDRYSLDNQALRNILDYVDTFSIKEFPWDFRTSKIPELERILQVDLDISSSMVIRCDLNQSYPNLTSHAISAPLISKMHAERLADPLPGKDKRTQRSQQHSVLNTKHASSGSSRPPRKSGPSRDVIVQHRSDVKKANKSLARDLGVLKRD
jgi:hypothetical protein